MQELKWHIETRKISELRDYEKNPRKITKKQFDHLKQNIEKFGLIDKPFINTDNVIIGGHQRLRILKRFGNHEVEVYVPNRSLSEKEVEELNYRHNENTGEWDYDILADQYNLVDLLNWGESPMEKESTSDENKFVKPKVIFEFDSEAALEEQSLLIEEAALTWNAQMKIKK